MNFDTPGWEIGKTVAEVDMVTSRTKVLNQLWEWWLRRPGAKLPERPAAEVVEDRYVEYQNVIDEGGSYEARQRALIKEAREKEAREDGAR